MAKGADQRRVRGAIRRRGKSLQVIVYSGIDPLTGKKLYLRESTTDEAEARRILRRLAARVDVQRHPTTNATFRTAMEAWLRTHEVEETTRASYEQYARVHLYPAFGDEPIGKVNARLLEEFYAELRRCRDRCDGRPKVEHRVDGAHECRVVKHRRGPGRPPAGGYPPHDCAETGCTVVECQPHACRSLAGATIRRIHFAIRGVLSAAERWEWITSNPAVIARKPRQPTPQPNPPTVAQAAQIIDAGSGARQLHRRSVARRDATPSPGAQGKRAAPGPGTRRKRASRPTPPSRLAPPTTPRRCCERPIDGGVRECRPWRGSEVREDCRCELPIASMAVER